MRAAEDESKDSEGPTYRVGDLIKSGKLQDWELEGFRRVRSIISLQSVDNQRGTARTTFQGPDGYYKVRIQYVDEDDGVSRVTLAVGDREVGTWRFDGNTGFTRRWKEIDGVRIEHGDVISLKGRMNHYEYCRMAGVEIDYLSKRFPYYYKNSVRGLRAEASNSWGAAGLNFYVASKLMWDTSADVEAIYGDFLDKAFGAAQEPMRRYYDRWQNHADETPEVVADAKADLRQAYEMANSDAVRRRIGQLYVYFDWYVAKRASSKLEKEDPARAKQLADRAADHWWRLYPAFLLHDNTSAAINRPFYPGFSRVEVEQMMAEYAHAAQP